MAAPHPAIVQNLIPCRVYWYHHACSLERGHPSNHQCVCQACATEQDGEICHGEDFPIEDFRPATPEETRQQELELLKIAHEAIIDVVSKRQ